MDQEISECPITLWLKKCREASDLSNVSKKTASTPTLSKTKSIGIKKRPKKWPGGASHKTPIGGDQFIPVRSTTNYEVAHFKVTREQEADKSTSPAQKEYRRLLSECLFGGEINKMKILSFKNKAPGRPVGFADSLINMYSKAPASTKSSTKYIPKNPDRILDAPEIVDDYYLNLIDWSPNNILAVALNTSVYLWNAGTGAIEKLLSLEGSDFVCSLSWIQEGDCLAVGTSMGVIQLWDCSEMRRLRIMGGHSARVSSLSWNSYILSSGSASGRIIHHDVRWRDHSVAVLSSHTQEVCGLKWSPDGRYLASGGNDNMLYIWPVVAGQTFSQPQPLYSLSAHEAAVKALAWCPWQHSILASGAGTGDRCIRFWNCNTGCCLSTIDTKSQVCGLQWSTTYRELISGHGSPNNQLIIWKYPSMTKVAELTGQKKRVLQLALCPDGSTVLSAGADETLRLWECFPPDPAKKKKDRDTAAPSMFRGIR